MNFQQLLDRISLQYDKKLPFALYSFSGSETVKCLLQNNDTLYSDEELTQNGFVLGPFDSRLETILISERESETVESVIEVSDIEKNRVEVSETQEDEEAY